MTDMRLLAELVEQASARYNDASGRRLAEIAQADGFDVSHSTLNKIRAGTYTSEPSVATLRAIAHLARVSEEKLLASIKDAEGIDDAATERAFVEWLNCWYRTQNQALAYARQRGISFADAEKELLDVKSMFEDTRGDTGRPWTPPWNPGEKFRAGERPWKREWWTTTREVPAPRGLSGTITEISLGGDWDVERVRARRETRHDDDDLLA